MPDETDHGELSLIEKIAVQLDKLEQRQSRSEDEMRRLSEKHDDTYQKTDQVWRQVNSVDPQNPGLMMQMYVMNRRFAIAGAIASALCSGGLIGIIGTIYLLFQILQAMDRQGVIVP